MDLTQLAMGGVVAAAVMLVLWPRRATGRQFLRRWHVAEPDDAQIAAVVRYLRDRRLLVVPFLLLIPVAKARLGVRPAADDPLNLFTLLGAVLLAVLLVESLAGLHRLRSRGPTRTAPLVRRRARDLVPRYAVWLHAVLTLVVLGVAVAGLAVQPGIAAALARLPANEDLPDRAGLVLADGYRADLAKPVGWPVLVGTVLTALVVIVVVWRASARPADRDDRVDRVLRVRSARVAVGIGMAITAALGVVALDRLSRAASLLAGHPTDGNWLGGSYPVGGPAFPAGAAVPGWLEALSGPAWALGLAMQLAGLLGWVWVANPPRAHRMPPVTSTA